MTQGQESKGATLARRKAGRLHMRVDLDNRILWQECADEQDMSLSSWIEAVCNREVLARRQERRLAATYPQKYC